MRITKGFALLAAMAAAAAAVAPAQDAGASLYKAKCQTCHGPDGMANSGVGKIMKVKPATDPSVKAMSEAQMIAAVRNGMGKMQPYKDSLTDAQIKDAVDHFRTLVK
jgi:mono/diheme cytochrome c family protein